MSGLNDSAGYTTVVADDTFDDYDALYPSKLGEARVVQARDLIGNPSTQPA